MSLEPFNSLHSAVKLVIWDLDDTLWSGSLAAGTMAPIAAHIDMVHRLVDRGIMCSICSRNDPDAARAALTQLGIWDLFVFPHIQMAPKGKMITKMVADMGLADSDVLFLDNNRTNLKEAQAFNRNLMVAEGSQDLSAMLDLPQLRGSFDPDHSTLRSFKQLEQGPATVDPLLCVIGGDDLSAIAMRCSDNRAHFATPRAEGADGALRTAGIVLVSLFEDSLAQMNAHPLEETLAQVRGWYKAASRLRDLETPLIVLGAARQAGDAVARDAFNALSRSFCATTPNAIFIDQALVPATAPDTAAALGALVNEHILRCDDMRHAA